MHDTSSGPPGLEPGWRWSNSFAALGPDFYSPMRLQPLAEPYLVGHSTAAAHLLGLAPDALQSSAWLDFLVGNQVPDGAQPLSSVYSGHQFGVWAGQLGDGRAVLLGELMPPDGLGSSAQEIQIKGSGLTPYSRMGDGRAVLRSSIREFLCSEAMHALGIPTTRALCVIGSDHPVYRELPETAAVVTRLAPSFIRFGHFEHFCHHDLHPQLRQLADYVIDRFYPQCRLDTRLQGNAYANFLQAVTERTARMVAQWQAVGFCHGVMNTDNMSILGLTIDYGPFQFLDGFDPGHICNHSDNQGRYAFHRQPNVAYWNLYCLGQALLPLIGDQELAIAALESYKTVFPQALDACMAAKLGFTEVRDGQRELVEGLLPLLAEQRVDYSIFWRRLSHWVAQDALAKQEPVTDLFLDRTGVDSWLLQYSEHLTLIPRGLAANLMLKTNPKYVLRNHLGELAIQAAQRKDFSVLGQLLQVLERPFDEHPEFESFAGFPPDWAAGIAISCSS
ncbi:MAG: YdiU family protein [Burkholderiales bacterium]|nr:YdiU family protein [Burkholderiales bacterium]